MTTAEIQDEKTGKIAAFKVGTGRLLGAAIFALLLMLGIAGRAEEKKPVVAGLGRANGQVLDADGKALAGAKVTLRIGEGIGSGPPAATTDAAGKWALLGLAPGRWRLTVQAVGWIDAEGWVDVPEEGPGKWVRLKLRPLSEATPGGAEVPHTIYSWLAKANALLAQGHAAEARGEYEKALRTLPLAQRPEVLRAIARTWYLEGDLERAVGAVEDGLKIAPSDAELRQLLSLLLTEMGRPAEADAFLAALASGAIGPPTEEVSHQELPPELAARLAAPAEAPRAGRPGSYKLALEERSPRSALSEVLRRASLDRAKELKDVPQALAYRLGDESFEVVVPDGEPPAAGWGLLVWVSPWEWGGLSSRLGPTFASVLAAHRMIWVGADRAGNDRPRLDRWGLALDAADQIQRLYRIDPTRLYAAGHSGGGRAASALALLYPDVFRGALMMMGVDWYRDLPVSDKPGASWPAPFHKPPSDLLRLARERSRLVLLTGERDFNRAS
ncbi:MAG TPA: carboxypeptidase regulatory-like domain-containing protein, partial [Thermoanaerobaculia bacterium]|nr:carboxypeptidase regulatory-like domain-containing protein [Thermoanaerobaculia bacterium]